MASVLTRWTVRVGLIAAVPLMAWAVPGCEQRGAPGGLSSAHAPAAAPTPPLPADEVERLYTAHCAACHGSSGHGDGPAAEQLYPKPRAFADSPFRFAATGGGDQARLQTLRHTIRQGMPRSGMPGFDAMLTDGQINGLAAHVLSLTQAAAGQALPTRDTLVMGPKPAHRAGAVAHGAQLYATYCASCHGATGRGDGPAMPLQRDALGRPIRPADFASGLFKSGQREEDLYRAIVLGVPGTPMAGYANQFVRQRADKSVNDFDAWALAMYVRQMGSTARAEGIAAGAAISVARAPDPSMIDDPLHAAWQDVPRKHLAVRPLWQRPESTLTLGVCGVKTDGPSGRIALRLEWDDRTCDVDQDLGVFADAVAVMFSTTSQVPALPMGVSMDGHSTPVPVDIWNWKASRQYDATYGYRHDVDAPRRLPAGDVFIFRMPALSTAARHQAGAAGEPQPGSPVAPRIDHGLQVNEADNRAAVAVENIQSDPRLVDHAALEATALGFGTLQYRPADAQRVRAAAVWARRTWTVLLVRDRPPSGEFDVDLDASERLPVAFAVWDGDKGDRDGIKLISGWHWLIIAGEPAQ